MKKMTVAECPGPEDKFYGDERMLTALQNTAGEPVSAARERVRKDLITFAGGDLTHDDCTYWLVEVLKVPPFWKRRIFAGKARVEKRRS